MSIKTTALTGAILLAGSLMTGSVCSQPARVATLNIRVMRAYQCNDTLEVVVDLQTLVGKQWTATPDDGREALQLHFIGNGTGKEGLWETRATTSHGEGRLALDVRSGDLPTWDLVRVVRTDSTGLMSAPLPMEDGDCA